MEDSQNYFLFISKDEYSQIFKLSQRIRMIYGDFIISGVSAVLVLYGGIYYIIFGVLPIKFGGAMALVILLPLIIEFIRVDIVFLWKLKHIDNLWISSKGIHLPIPISKKEKRYFVNFDDIDKIEIWASSNPEKRLTTTVIYLKRPYKMDFLLQVPTQIRLYLKDYEEFYSAVYKATNGKVLVMILRGR